MAKGRQLGKSDGVTKDGSAAAGLEVPTQTRVLLAEDDESFVDALVIGLAREGFDVTVAGDGPGSKVGSLGCRCDRPHCAGVKIQQEQSRRLVLSP